MTTLPDKIRSDIISHTVDVHRISVQTVNVQNGEPMKAWTDYPITELGDTPHVEAPVREIEVLA